jgi:hypothetical protein
MRRPNIRHPHAGHEEVDACVRLHERIARGDSYRPAELVERYADRWSVEVRFEESRLEESRQVAGVGQARNRTPPAVQRTVPFSLLCVSLVVCWYVLHGQPAADLAAHRARAPWYRTKHTVSLADMLNALRRELLAAQFVSSRLVTSTLEELLHAQAAGAADAA